MYQFRLATGLLLLLIAVNSFEGVAQSFSFPNGRKQQSISFDLVKNLIIIPIYINQKGPFDFILDTGVGPLVVLDSKLKDSLNIAYPREIKISGYGNFDEIQAFLGATHVKIGDAAMESVGTVFLKTDVTNLSGFVGRKIYGLIGYTFFSSFMVKVNYTAKRLSFTTANRPFKLKGEKINLVINGNKPFVNLRVKQGDLDTTINAVIDCGAGHSISLEALNKKPFPIPQKTISGSLGSGLVNQIMGKIGRVEELHLGSFKFKQVLSKYPNYNIDSAAKIERNANLGAEILSRFNIIYDYANSAMYLKKNATFKAPFAHDMSGIELYSDPSSKDAHIIHSVDPNSPAELAGLNAGDQILALNLKNIESFSITAIDEVLRGKFGNLVIIEVWRNGATFIKVLKLKQRI